MPVAGDREMTADNPLADDAKVWRYMKFSRFIWLLQKKQLWMSRADRLGDSWELSLTVSAKILMAYALGVFGRKTEHDLRLIRELRNGFAHVRKALGFSVPEIAAVCSNLYLPDMKRIAKFPQPMLRVVNGKRSTPDMKDAKQRYLTACYTISAGLLLFAQQPKVVPLRVSGLP
jgi:hypothetical protein